MKKKRKRLPLAANSDPDTSHDAARDLVESGELARKKAFVLDFVRTLRQPATSYEIAKAMKADRHEVAKRLPDLRDSDKAVENRGRRKCAVTGRRALTWFVVDGNEAVTRTNEPQPISAETPAAGSAPVQELATEPATCTRCGSTGRRKVSAEPAVFSFCDELFNRPCSFAERRRRISGDPNFELSPSELEVVKGTS
ncbi:MAG: hypothetical protein LAP61_23040 [Acidobacteriia bacterium]|nr:hypothetical protein [Terriglobia bacterium]